MASLSIGLVKATLYFKMNKLGDLVLLYGTNMKVKSGSSPYLLGDIEVDLTIPLAELELKKMLK